jgi:hypothetical protein
LNGGAGGFALTQAVLDRFSVGTLALEATAGNITIGAGGFFVPTIGNLALTTEAGGVTSAGAITTGTLAFSSAGTASFASGNRIQSLGRALVTTGGLTFENIQGMNLTGSIATLGGGSADLTVAGQFYNYSGLALPFAGTTGRAVVRSLSMMGGMPNQISALAGFTPSYNFTDPGTSRAMIYAVSPLTMFAPSGTVIAGVDLSGTQTGGGQLNTFFTGSDNLNWMIADFGKFNLPKVEPARMEYMLYQQRVEPETRSLPQPMMRELTMELGRPPTVEELQAREVAKRQSVQMRSGAILERSSFDEEVEEPKQEAAGPSSVIDGGKPQASVNSESEKRNAEAGPTGSDPKTVQGNQLATDPARGLTPSAKKQTDNKRDANGPMLRSGPQRAVALRTELLDGDQIIQTEREKATVGVAAPFAGGH